MDHAANDDQQSDGRVSAAPGSHRQPQSPSQRGQECGQKNRPHGDHTQAEKGVGDLKKSASMTSGGLVIQSPPDMDQYRQDQSAANPSVKWSPPGRRQAGQVPAHQQRLKKQQDHGDNACKSGDDVDRIAPCEQRTHRGSGDRHNNGDH